MAFWVSEVAAFAALKKRGADLSPNGWRCEVEKGFSIESDLGKEQCPSMPGLVVFLMCSLSFGVKDSVLRVIV